MSDPIFWDEFNYDLCNFLQFGGEEGLRNKAVTLPRNARKSTIGTIWYSEWRALRNPDIRILWIFNTAENAMKKLDKLRADFENNPRIYKVFPEVIPNFRKTTWTRKAACLARPHWNEESTFEVAGITSSIVSRHYDVIIFDDPTSPERHNVTEEFVIPNIADIEHSIGKLKLATFLFSNPMESELLINTTRWADNDIVDYVKKNRVEGLTKFAHFERKIIDGGKPLMQRFPESMIEQMRRDLGPYFFSCLCMNTPLEEHLRTFKKGSMSQRWNAETTFMGRGMRAVVIDPAMGKERTGGCHTALLAMEHVDGYMIWLDERSGFMAEAETAKNAVDMAVRCNCKRIGIEDVAYQMALRYPILAELKERGITDVVVEAIKVGKTQKDDKISALSPLFDRGRILLPEHETDVERQLLAFPFSSKKDLADCMAMHMSKYYSMYKALSAEELPKPLPVVKEGEMLFDVDKYFRELEKESYGEYGYNIADTTEPVGGRPWAF